MDEEPPDLEILPCGCQMWTEGETFYYVPCDSNCRFFLYLLEESRKQSREITYRRGN